MTTTPVVTLADFLLARIAEDEAGVRPVVGYCEYFADRFGPRPWDSSGPRQHYEYDSEVIVGVDRVLAECEAKRRIVEHLAEYHEWNEPDLLALLALPYADHPDYREEWKP